MSIYFNFFVQSFIFLFNFTGANIGFTPLHILLPLGISFFTFQMIGYLIDVNNEEIEPSNDLVSLFTYLAYFPKIIAGPIERVQRFLPQIQKKREFNYELTIDGLRQILWGLFKKIVIADNCTSRVNQIFNEYHQLNGSTLMLGAFFYIISVYTDFSGYSDMACGISKLFNIKITNNFTFPFFSTNISDFWKKWHISLTSWMMDYVFTPLNFILRQYKKFGLILSILLTFFIVGIWHGANLTFIVFGLLHGLYFIPLILIGSINRIKVVAEGKLFPSFFETLGMLCIFLLLSFTAVFLRAENITVAFDYLSKMFSLSSYTYPSIFPVALIVIIIVFVIVEWISREKLHPLHFESKMKILIVLRPVFISIVIWAIILWGASDNKEFIYSQF